MTGFELLDGWSKRMEDSSFNAREMDGRGGEGWRAAKVKGEAKWEGSKWEQ